MKKTSTQLDREIKERLQLDAKYKFRERPNSYPLAIITTSMGRYQIFKRPNDFLVMFYPAIPEKLSEMKASERLGTFATLEEVDRRITDLG